MTTRFCTGIFASLWYDPTNFAAALCSSGIQSSQVRVERACHASSCGGWAAPDACDNVCGLQGSRSSIKTVSQRCRDELKNCSE
eukprot:scaffold6029_cov63-Phaeocystis_antarctica.AAC.5